MVILMALAGCSGESGSRGFLGLPPLLPSSSSNEQDERERRQLEVFDSLVRNPSADIDPQLRRKAAEELIAMGTPEATERLAEALRSGDPVVSNAVIDAMESTDEPIEGLLSAAADTLQDVSGEELEKLSLVLPRYGPEALNNVAALAHNGNEPPARRTGPIYALAAFRSRQGAEELMVLLDEQRGEPQEIVVAAGESLERLTGVPYGADASRWRQWWDELKNQPIEDWLQIMVLHLSEKTSDLERDLQKQKRENEAIAETLAAALRDVYLNLSADEQLERLTVHLDSNLAPVRAFALGRVERRLRDSERIPEPLQEKLVARVNDNGELPSSRLLAAQLLNDLNHPATEYLVASALEQERDSTIAAGYLEILAKRPTPAALHQVSLWLTDAAAGDAAARTLWAMVAQNLIDEGSVPTVRLTVRNAMEWQTTPGLTRVLGAIGDSNDQEQIELLLDAVDPALRRAAAEGLGFSGRLDPLMDRVGDPDIYPYVIRLLARQANLETLRTLARLAPPEAHRQEWTQTVTQLAQQLPPGDLIEADAILASLDHVEPPMRIAVLAGVPRMPADALSLEQRSTLLVRLAQLQIGLGNYQRAYEVLEWPNGTPPPPELVELRFEAAVLAGRYDEAEGLNNDVTAWIALLERLIDERPQAGAAIRDEIRRRFTSKLEGETAEHFQAVDERLMQTTASADTANG